MIWLLLRYATAEEKMFPKCEENGNHLSLINQCISNIFLHHLSILIRAAINFFKLMWNYPSVFDNVIVHSGDFHFMKEIFTALGKLVKGS